MSREARTRHRIKTVGKVWTPFQSVPITDEMRAKNPALEYATHMYVNSRYEYWAFTQPSPVGGFVHLVVGRHGLVEPILPPELQQIKAELFGDDAVAIEIYPARTIVPLKSARHLWICPTTWDLPCGFERASAWGGPA
jgi:hypothetical protein